MKIRYILLATALLSVLMLNNACKKGDVPVVQTAETLNITGTTATSGGTILNEGSSTVLERGVCWSKQTSPKISGNRTSDGAGAGDFTSAITGLDGATTYYVRAYATNDVGVGYGMTMSFTTLGGAPVCMTYPALVSSPNTATLLGLVNANFLQSTVSFEYGTSASYGNTIACSQNPVTGNSVTSVSANITSLQPATTYHFRVKAVNSSSTIYGDDMQFTTYGSKPSINYPGYSGISDTEVALHGSVNANYMTTVVTFEYGLTTEYGGSSAAMQNPVTGNNDAIVNVVINSLTPGVVYHFRIKAVNELGTTYSDDKMFELPAQTSDIEGNLYPTVTIGSQTWMAANLMSTKFNDGESIPLVTSSDSWHQLVTPGYCWYENSEYYKDPYGPLYNWYVAASGKICPIGWHVPSDEEWTTLTDYLGGLSGSGGKLKAVGTDYWAYPNTGATNESGFSALPAGYRTFNSDGSFFSLGLGGTFWSSTQVTSSAAWGRAVINTSADVLVVSNEMRYGTSIRCIKD